MTTEAQLRQALQGKASSVHPSNDALDKIQSQLDGVVVTDATVTYLQQPRPIVRYISLAAIGLAAIGLLGFYSQRRNITELDLAVPSTTSTSVDSPVTTVPIDEATTVPTEATTATTPDELMPPTGPPAATKIQAATKFLNLIGVTSPVEFADRENTVSVMRAGDQTPIVQLDVAVVSGGWAVTGASSTGITAEIEPYDSAEVDSITVTGLGRGFEATLGVEMISALDGELLYRDYTMAGMPDPLPYSKDLPTVGSETAWVVVSGDGGGEGVLQEFAAEPVVYVGSADPRSYGVFRIETTDRDKGLNLRSSPGTDENQVLATLPAGTSGVKRTASFGVLVGDSVWREVMTPDGERGWAHSSFMTPLEPAVTDDELLAVGEALAFAVQQDTHWAFPELPWSERVQIAFAWTGDLDNKSFRFDAAEFVAGGIWGPDSFRDWAVPEATFGQPVINSTYWDFLSLPRTGQIDVTVGTGQYAYPFEQSMIDSYLPNLRSVVISDSQSDGPWSAVHLFVEPSTAGPRIVAIAVSHQVP